MQTFELIRQNILDTIDFGDDTLEAKVESVITASGVVMQSAQMIDLVKEDLDTSEQLDGLTTLASLTGKANLSPADFDKLKDSVRKIVSYPANPSLESALESTFFSILDLQVAAKDLNEYVSLSGIVE